MSVYTCIQWVVCILPHSHTCIHLHMHYLLKAGIVKEMNELASRFMTEDASREDIVSEAATVAEEHDDSK